MEDKRRRSGIGSSEHETEGMEHEEPLTGDASEEIEGPVESETEDESELEDEVADESSLDEADVDEDEELDQAEGDDYPREEQAA